ncbi:hypothetical protein IEE_05221 [Bacillus cereus BAG5X1-1]|uniref:Cytochrome P450 n=1 Tax=Bacillus cereus BAG5X1-1 TaxID=1053189 RepID=J8AD68_BACCE|nr:MULTISPECIES: cytochrome P450 [Bacillus cereus group]EJQ37435.1 hypothetical protein IEE_05221 [Bacillus cereus BAG5X1-1]PEU19700.1 cytochrome P450 [Bacillus wiedmannii]
MSVKIEPIFLHEITQFKTNQERWNPYPWFKEMRENTPIYYDNNQDVWNVFRYDDVKRVISDHKLFSNKRSRSFVPIPNLTDNKSNVNFSDPPIHTHRRTFLNKAFTPKTLNAWEPRIQAIANEVIEQIGDRKQIDFLQDFAILIPNLVIADLLGVPSKDRSLFKEWSNIIFLPKEQQEGLKQKKMQAFKEFYEYLIPIVQEKRKNPSHDIISDLIKAESKEERLTDQEVIASAINILGGGYKVKTILLANSIYCFLKDKPGTYQELHKHPHLIPQAIEEVFRYRFPGVLERQILQDTNVLGHEMKKGQIVVAWTSSANRDESHFPEADEFNIHRLGNQKHLAFGAGRHFCPGTALSRMEAKIALTTFIQHFSNISLSPDFNVTDHLVVSNTGASLKSLPLRIGK